MTVLQKGVPIVFSARVGSRHIHSAFREVWVEMSGRHHGTNRKPIYSDNQLGDIYILFQLIFGFGALNTMKKMLHA